MNYIFLSPHFPPNYYQFCKGLKKVGANVLGLGDTPYDNLRQELRDSLTEYYRVDDLHNYDQLLRAVGFFTHKYGKMDGIDSNNEYWLETEARLRTDFNINGIRMDTLDKIKRKSVMKEVFRKAGAKVARGMIVHSIEDALKLIDDTGYPVVAKPDTGVGAAHTYKIHNHDELVSFFQTKPEVTYFMEEFIDGQIVSFDGLTNRDGDLLFYTVHAYEQGVMEVVNNDRHIYYYSFREIPEDIETTGKKILKAFDVRGRFFHFEFFRRYDNQELVALEVNMRPPGGFTTDMFNYACDFDIYYEWAHMLMHNRLSADYTRKYHVCYVGRKNNKNYLLSHDEVLDRFRNLIVQHDPIDVAFSRALGNYCYILRSTDLEEIFKAQKMIHQLKE